MTLSDKAVPIEFDGKAYYVLPCKTCGCIPKLVNHPYGYFAVCNNRVHYHHVGASKIDQVVDKWNRGE